MKRFGLVAIVAVMSLRLTAAQQTIDILTGDVVVDPTVSTAPMRLIENLDNGVRVTYTFSSARMDSVTTDWGSGAFIVSFDGFGISEVPGQPALPSKLDAIEVPSAGDVVLTIESIDYSDYFFEIAPASAPEFESNVSALNTAVTPISLPAGFFPLQPVSIVSSQSHYDKDVCFLSISPVAYDHATKSVRIANKIVYTVSFGEAYASGGGQRKARGVSQDDGLVDNDPVYSNMVLNAQSSSNDDNYGEVVQDYLILTTSECVNAVNKFADWKRAFGFRTHVSVLPTGDDVRSDAIVKDSIEVYAKKYGRTLKYLLIVGDTTAIQSYKRVRTHSSEHPHLSDYYYGCTTNHNFKLIPDLHRGRIPAKTNQEALNAFEKIMAYERCANANSNFFKNGLHCAYYQNTKQSPSYDTRRFVCTSEEVLESARSLGLNPIRVYSANVIGTGPTFYSGDIRYETYNKRMPDEIVYNFNWAGNTSDIKSFLENKDGVSYVLYRGHGDISEWAQPQYKYTDILNENHNISDKTSSSNKMFPVVFSIACFTGKFDDTNCFANHSILSKHKGSSGIIASYERSFSGFNDAFTLAMFDAFYPEPVHTTYIAHRDSIKGFTYKPVYRIGEIMDQGLFRMAKKKFMTAPGRDSINHTIYTYEIFHCFGDPSMMIWCQEPTAFDNAKIDLDHDSKICNVTTGGEPAYISFYDKNVNAVKCYYGTEASFTFSEIHDKYTPVTGPYEYVVISAPNKIPTIKSVWYNYSIPVNNAKIENISIDNLKQVYIEYRCDENDDVKLIFTSVSTGASRIIELPKGEFNAIIDCSNDAPGSYIVTLVVNGNNIDSSTILIN